MCTKGEASDYHCQWDSSSRVNELLQQVHNGDFGLSDRISENFADKAGSNTDFSFGNVKTDMKFKGSSFDIS